MYYTLHDIRYKSWATQYHCMSERLIVPYVFWHLSIYCTLARSEIWFRKQLIIYFDFCEHKWWRISCSLYKPIINPFIFLLLTSFIRYFRQRQKLVRTLIWITRTMVPAASWNFEYLFWHYVDSPNIGSCIIFTPRAFVPKFRS